MVFPKFLLSELYARSRSKNGRYVKQHEGNSGNGAGESSDLSRSDVASGKRPRITVEQTFEMNSVLAPHEGHEADVSQDGSEKDLVTDRWKRDCYNGEDKLSLTTYNDSLRRLLGVLRYCFCIFECVSRPPYQGLSVYVVMILS